ncbi:TerC family protein [Paenibacillaceae bacterium]|nr:TerC family protein [Paenibacillaceae bacterium]
MNFFSLEFASALLTIVFIDLILAGDNAIVIGMAARNLPKEQQKPAILWGTAGAVAIRIVATVLVVYLLNIPWLHLIGGLLLLWIAYKLIAQPKDHDDVKAGSTLFASIRTIIIADAAMGIDNVIAIAGAAHGSLILVVLGLLISIPIIVWGSTLFIKLINRYRWIIYAGGAVLAYTAGKMITNEPVLSNLFTRYPAASWIIIILAVLFVLAAGYWHNAYRGEGRAKGREKAR